MRASELFNKRPWVRRLFRIVQVFFVGVLVMIGLVLVIMYFAGEIGGPVLYQLPGDYRGWVGVRYDDPSCVPLRKEGWYLVIPFDASGKGCTSSPVPSGWRYVRYEYLYSDGRRRELVGPDEQVWSTGPTGPQRPRIEGLFIGSKAEMERLWRRQHDFLREMKQKR